MRPGASVIMRFERHVYQAGSRVGALIEGSHRNVQPITTSTRAIASSRKTGLPSMLERASGTRTASPVRSCVSAICSPLSPGSALARARLGQAREPRKDRRRQSGGEHGVALMARLGKVLVLVGVLLREVEEPLRDLRERE